jgi:uracil-DNA glycosylase
MINANPGGTLDNYRVVDVMAGAHEYIEGRASGPTTANGAKILQHIVGSEDPESIRALQVLNRFFRRSPVRPSARLEGEYMAEAQPFLEELIAYIQPEALLFGGDAGVELFAKAHGGSVRGNSPVMGPNGTHEAVYFREYEMRLPYYKAVPAYGIYHPSKLNAVFRDQVFPLLRTRLGSVAA